MKALLNITPIFLAPLANSFNTIKTTTTTTKIKQISFLFLVHFFFLLCHLLKAVDISFSSLYFRHTQPIQLFICKKKSISVGEAAEALKAVLPRGCSQFVSLESTR